MRRAGSGAERGCNEWQRRLEDNNGSADKIHATTALKSATEGKKEEREKKKDLYFLFFIFFFGHNHTACVPLSVCLYCIFTLRLTNLEITYLTSPYSQKIELIENTEDILFPGVFGV